MATNTDPEVVEVADGAEHGYFGAVTETEPNASFTVAGVTGGTAKAADAPKSVTREGTKPRS